MESFQWRESPGATVEVITTQIPSFSNELVNDSMFNFLGSQVFLSMTVYLSYGLSQAADLIFMFNTLNIFSNFRLIGTKQDEIEINRKMEFDISQISSRSRSKWGYRPKFQRKIVSGHKSKVKVFRFHLKFSKGLPDDVKDNLYAVRNII